MQPTTVVVQGHDKNMGIQMYNVHSKFLQAALTYEMCLNNKYIAFCVNYVDCFCCYDPNSFQYLGSLHWSTGGKSCFSISIEFPFHTFP